MSERWLVVVDADAEEEEISVTLGVADQKLGINCKPSPHK